MKTINILICAVLFSVSFTACKKYEEGPGVSFRSTKARVANNWKVESYTINGVDNTSSLNNIGYTEVYDENGNYSYTTNAGGGSGKWEFQNKDMEIKRSGVASQSTQTLFILKLKEGAFWYYYMDGNDRHEMHLQEN